MGFIERLTADLICLRGALRALRYTTHIAKNPTRVFPQLIEELADKYGDAPALLSDRETLQLSRARRALEPLCALGAGAGHRQGRHRLPADAEPARIPGDLARRHPRRRRGGAAQHQPDRARRSPIASTWSTPKHIIVDAELLAALQSAQPHLTANAKIWLHGDAAADLPRIDREIEGLSGDAARGQRAPRAHHRGPRAVHLHVGHHRPAQGRQHQPLPADARDATPSPAS